VDDWTEVACVDPVSPSDDTAELARVLDSFLSQHGLDRRSVADDDIRIDVVYLGPDKGTCGYRLMVRAAVLSQGSTDAARGANDQQR
jgi:hypothetical protein